MVQMLIQRSHTCFVRYHFTTLVNYILYHPSGDVNHNLFHACSLLLTSPSHLGKVCECRRWGHIGKVRQQHILLPTCAPLHLLRSDLFIFNVYLRNNSDGPESGGHQLYCGTQCEVLCLPCFWAWGAWKQQMCSDLIPPLLS